MAIAGDEGGGPHVRFVGFVCFTCNSLLSKLRWIAHTRGRSDTSNHSGTLSLEVF